MTPSILLIAEDTKVLEELQPTLLAEGYRLPHALPGLDATRETLNAQPDFVIHQVDSRDKGWDFCARLLAFLHRPLFLLLSTSNRLHRVKGLEFAADGCMTQPILNREVIGRRRSVAADRLWGLTVQTRLLCG